MTRRERKSVREALRHGRHVLDMREDVMRPDALNELRTSIASLRAALAQKDAAACRKEMERMSSHLEQAAPAPSYAGLRENVDVLVVAFAVAMAFRAYFIQPFKIPTGSMQPTLNGITYATLEQPDVTHRMPLKLVRWLIFGDWYGEIRVQSTGIVTYTREHMQVGSRTYRLHKNMYKHAKPNELMEKGDVIASSVRMAGDHLFVNKVAWNFRGPRRDEIIVFTTDGLEGLKQKTHYIKRLVGLPGETVSIDPPYLNIDGARVEGFPGIHRIENMEGGREGYRLPGNYNTRPVLEHREDTQSLSEDEFFVMGDNTASSFDSRFWGAVRRRNLVGPAVFVYWPFGRHWGRIR